MAILTTHWMVQKRADGEGISLSLKDIFGSTKVLTLPLDLRGLADGMKTYEGGALIQDAFPDLTIRQREFLMTGIADAECCGASDGTPLNTCEDCPNRSE